MRLGSVIKSLAVVLALLFCLDASARGQVEPIDRLSVFGGIGGNLAVARLADLADAGLNGELGLELRPFPVTPEVSFLLSGSYSLLWASNAGFGDVSVLTGTLDLKMAPNWRNPTRFYLLAGGGIGQIELRHPPTGQFFFGDIRKETKPLLEIGGGFERRPDLGGIGFFVQVKGVNVFSSEFGDYRFGKLAAGILW